MDDIIVRLYCAKNTAELETLIDPLSEQKAKRLLKLFLSNQIRERKQRMVEQGYELAEDGSVISSPPSNLTPEQERAAEIAFDKFVKQTITDTANEYRREHGMPLVSAEDDDPPQDT